jgi:hypothetical protein
MPGPQTLGDGGPWREPDHPIPHSLTPCWFLGPLQYTKKARNVLVHRSSFRPNFPRDDLQDEVMDINHWLLICVFAIGGGTLFGFFVTKTKGFGRFATSVLLLLLVAIMTGVFYAAEKMPLEVASNIFFAIIGFAGGLFTGKKDAPMAGNPAPK